MHFVKASIPSNHISKQTSVKPRLGASRGVMALLASASGAREQHPVAFEKTGGGRPSRPMSTRYAGRKKRKEKSMSAPRWVAFMPNLSGGPPP